MTTGVYGIYDKQSKTCLYVGQSLDVKTRFKQHKKRLRAGTHLTPFVKWMEDNNKTIHDIEFKILEECENVDSVKNRIEAKWFGSENPLFFGKKPSDNLCPHRLVRSRTSPSQGEDTGSNPVGDTLRNRRLCESMIPGLLLLHGVTGNTADSGSVVLGSNPGGAAIT